MDSLELILIAIALSMDAFAIAICTGMARKVFRLTEAIKAGLYFGVAQAVMPIFGYLIGGSFADRIIYFGHWVAFALLVFIGGKMLIESVRTKNNASVPVVSLRDENALHFSKLFPLAVATSIDALAFGVSFAFLNMLIVSAAITIGLITFTLSAFGVRTGFLIGARFQPYATFIGAIMLMAIGLILLLEHTLAG